MRERVKERTKEKERYMGAPTVTFIIHKYVLFVMEFTSLKTSVGAPVRYNTGGSL